MPVVLPDPAPSEYLTDVAYHRAWECKPAKPASVGTPRPSDLARFGPEIPPHLPSTSSMGHAVYTSTPTVTPTHFFPGPPQYVGPEYAVIERMKPSVPAPLGRQV